MVVSAKAHFESVRPLIDFERRLVQQIVSKQTPMASSQELATRYAVNLAKLSLVRTPGGHDVDLSGAVGDFRGWLVDNLRRISLKGPIDPAGLSYLLPDIKQRVVRTRKRLREQSADRMPPELIENEVCHKELVLALGGGGGSGFAHLGVFSLLHDISWTPSLIVGASMGSLIGLFRAIKKDWDPVGTMLALPRRFDRGDLFRPNRGTLKYGFPGAFFLRLNEISRLTLDLLINQPRITFEELQIPLEIVTTGIRVGMKAALREVPGSPGSFRTYTGLRLRKRVAGVMRVLSTLVDNRRFLEEVVFGRDPATAKTTIIDAVGFSCAVPGLFCYDLPSDVHEGTRDTIDAMFAERKLWGLADGGVVNNVPARIAWESVHAGTTKTRNAFIYALDPFAPKVNSNVMFIPLQRIAALSVAMNQPFASLYRAYASPPSPLELVLSWQRASAIISEAQLDLDQDRALLQRIKEPLPRFEELVLNA